MKVYAKWTSFYINANHHTEDLFRKKKKHDDFLEQARTCLKYKMMFIL